MAVVKTSDKSMFCIRSADGKRFLRIGGSSVDHIIARTNPPPGISSYTWIAWGRSAERASYPIDLDAYQRNALVDIARDTWRKNLKERQDTLDSELDELDLHRKMLDAVTKDNLVPLPPSNNGGGWRGYYYSAKNMPDISKWVDISSVDDTWANTAIETINDGIYNLNDRIRQSRRDISMISRDLNDPLEWVMVEIRTEITTTISPV